MKLFEIYITELNRYPRFKRRNKWADKFLIAFAIVGFAFLMIKFSGEWSYEEVHKMLSR